MLLVSCCWNTQQKCQPDICTSRLWEPFKYHIDQASPWELSLSNWDEALYQWLGVFCFCTPTVRRFIPNLINRVVSPQSTISVFSTTDTDRVKVGRGSWFCTGSLANWGLSVWFARNLVTSKANNLWCLICSAADKPTHVRGIPNLEVSYSRSAATFRPVIKSVSRVGPTVGDDLLNCVLECVCIKSWLYIAKQALDGIPPELFFKDPFHQVCACCKQWVSNVVGAWQR